MEARVSDHKDDGSDDDWSDIDTDDDLLIDESANQESSAAPTDQEVGQNETDEANPGSRSVRETSPFKVAVKSSSKTKWTKKLE